MTSQPCALRLSFVNNVHRSITMSVLSMLVVVSYNERQAHGDEYDPLAVPKIAPGETLDLAVTDPMRERQIPIRVYLPWKQDIEPKSAPENVVLFSHGLGGSRTGSAFLGHHWAARGYVVVFLQHPGSDEAVWKDQPLAARWTAMREAASAKNFMLRAQDVRVVIDQLEAWGGDREHPLFGHVDPKRVGMSGHSFGGQTTQAVSGQSFPLGGQRLTDPRVKAAIVMSPSVPDRGDIQKAFGGVSIPWMLMTGTHDTAAVGTQTPESRRRVFPALALGNKFELVLDKAEHSAFTERPLPGDKQRRNPSHHRSILALSTAFWDAYLRDDEAARGWLQGDGPRRILQSEDAWQSK